ncbi:MAG: CpaD family pilus assembly lipoprotein [Rhizomicrobium sp.]
MWTTKDIARFAAIGSLLLAGSCAAPTSDGVGYVADPEVNHPISVEPAYHSIKLPFSMTNEGLMPEDAAHFSLFVEDFMNSGNGAISITAPSGSGANSAISYFGERLASLGVPRDRILVGTKPGDGDTRVEIALCRTRRMSAIA